MDDNNNLLSLISRLHTKQYDRCTHLLDNSVNGNGKYAMIIPAEPAIGILYVTRRSADFISGHVRMRGKDNGSYPYKYLEMLENLLVHDRFQVYWLFSPEYKEPICTDA